MTTTLVGIFDSADEAARARENLLQQGLPREAMHVTDNRSLTARGTRDDEREHRGFFARLFGIGEDDAHVDEYSQAMRGGSALLTVTVADDAEARRVESLLQKAGADSVREGGAAQARGAAGETLKVMEEQLQVGKRTVETGGLRIRQHVTERPVREQIELCEERAIVERRPVDRMATPDEVSALSMQDRELEIRERAEHAVVGKTARVVEEVRVGKEVTGHTETIEDTVRRTDVDIEQLTAQQAARQRQGGNVRGTPPAR